MLPSPLQVVQAFITEFPALMEHSFITLAEAFLGLTLEFSWDLSWPSSWISSNRSTKHVIR